MCGIFGIYKHQGSPKFDYIPLIKDFFNNVMSRGRDATGYAYVHKDTLYFNKMGIDAGKFIADGYVDGLKNDFSVMIGHVRHSTRGTPKDNRNNHPLIADDVVVFALVHNGVISGDYHGNRALNAEVDTAILRAVISDNLESGKFLPDAIKEAVEGLAGSMTTAIISPKFDGIILTKVRNPLWLAFIPQLKITVFASTDDILKDSLDTFFPKFNGVFPPYYMYEPPDESLVVVTENGVDVSRINRRDSTWSSAYDWRTFGTATAHPATVSTQKTLKTSEWKPDVFDRTFQGKPSTKSKSKLHDFSMGDVVKFNPTGQNLANKIVAFKKVVDRMGTITKVKLKQGMDYYDILFVGDILVNHVRGSWLQHADMRTAAMPWDVDDMEEDDDEEDTFDNEFSSDQRT